RTSARRAAVAYNGRQSALDGLAEKRFPMLEEKGIRDDQHPVDRLTHRIVQRGWNILHRRNIPRLYADAEVTTCIVECAPKFHGCRICRLHEREKGPGSRHSLHQ